MLTRARRVVEACEDLLGGPVLHYHSKNLVKYPEEGGVWNWHQDVRSVIAVVSSATLASLTRVTAPLIFLLAALLPGFNNVGHVDATVVQYGYWYKDFFLTPDMLTAYFAIDRQTMDNGCIKLLKVGTLLTAHLCLAPLTAAVIVRHSQGSNTLGRIDHIAIGDQQGADPERVELAAER